MEDGKSLPEQYREARLKAIPTNEKLGTLDGAAEVLGVAQGNTVGMWERGECTPSNKYVIRMADVYNEPSLKANYCAMQCQIGMGSAKKVCNRSLEQMAIRLFGAAEEIATDVKALLIMAANGAVDDHEVEHFSEIVQKLGGIKNAIHALELYAEKNGL